MRQCITGEVLPSALQCLKKEWSVFMFMCVCVCVRCGGGVEVCGGGVVVCGGVCV